MNPPVFFLAAAIVVAFVIGGVTSSAALGGWFASAQGFISQNFGWYYVAALTFFLIFCIWLMFSRFGDVKLSADNEEPEFSFFGWIAMLFTAGMGIGLVFWSVGEPLTHYANPPLAEGGTAEAMRESLAFTFYHWGLHAWGVYVVLGLALAYFHFRMGLPLAPRTVLYPFIGERFRGPIGHAVDILCIVGTLLGVATSLGFGAAQINAGLSETFGLPANVTVQVLLIIGITVIATLSVVIGIQHGIQRLATINMVLAMALLAFVFIAGPTVFELKVLMTGMGEYIDRIVQLSFWLSLDAASEWQASWTLFYWGWWISWSPFVAIFVARISKGRTIREFVLSVLLLPTLMTFTWFAVFGGAGLWFETNTDAGLAATVAEDVSLGLHALMAQLPLQAIMSVVATLLIAIFFITSSDSGSLVIDMIASGGHPNPARAQRVFWAVSEGAVAIVLLLAGGLAALQSAAITAGLPMSLLLIAAVVGLVKALQIEPIPVLSQVHVKEQDVIKQAAE